MSVRRIRVVLSVVASSCSQIVIAFSSPCSSINALPLNQCRHKIVKRQCSPFVMVQLLERISSRCRDKGSKNAIGTLVAVDMIEALTNCNTAIRVTYVEKNATKDTF